MTTIIIKIVIVVKYSTSANELYCTIQIVPNTLKPVSTLTILIKDLALRA
jgi:hypothetical protein